MAYMAARSPYDIEAHKFERVANNVRKCDETMTKSLMKNRRAQRALGYEITGLLRKIINEEVDSRKWGTGFQSEENRGVVSFTTSESSARIRWTGGLVKVIEYGAGMERVGSYPGITVNFDSKIDDRTAVTGATKGNTSGYTNKAWYFQAEDGGNLDDAGKGYNTITFGWAAMAPFYKTMLALSTRNAKQLRFTQYQHAVNQALRDGAREIFDVPE